MSSSLTNLLFVGLGWTDIAITLNRIAVGAFFMHSGYHKLFNTERHRAFVEELKGLGVPALGFNQWWVPSVEFGAGAGVVVGLLAPLAALGLLVIILVAIATTGRQRVELYKPIDRGDRIDDWLYLPEVLYAFMLIMVISGGAGPYSLDALILRLMSSHA
ncbi:MAG TPA: DoxX family protein [Methylovirgula sp.]|jgi:putative oxidoreductase